MDAVAGGGSQTIPSDLSVSFSTFQLYLLSVPLRSLSLSLRPTSRSWIQITDAPPTPVAREYTTECAAVRGQTEASGEDELPLVTTRRIWRRSRARMRSRRRVRCSRCPARSAALGARLDQLASIGAANFFVSDVLAIVSLTQPAPSGRAPKPFG